MASLTAKAQRFFNLTADEVRVDTLLPVFNYAYPLGAHYADSTYTVTIEYPEFVPMSKEEIMNYECLMRNVEWSAAPMKNGEFSMNHSTSQRSENNSTFNTHHSTL